MTRHVLFFVHGMGTHDATWHEAGHSVLRNALGDYAAFRGAAFDSLIEAVPVIYDDVIETWRQRMAADFAAFRGALLGGLAPVDAAKASQVNRQLDRIGSWIGAGEPKAVWSHAMDVVLYRWFALLRMAIDVSVARQILARIQSGNLLTWSVIGHSLGTSVVHNVLNALYGAGLDGIAPLTPAETRLRAVMMIANVSRVLQRSDAKVLESRVRPGSASADRLCAFYINARHRLDPFVYPKPFNPDLWPDTGTFGTDAYQHVQPSHVHFDRDSVERVHDLDHYLKNPRVHVPLFRALFGSTLLGEGEFAAAKAQFDAVILSNNIDAARSRLESLLPAPSGNWQTLISLFKRIRG